MDNAESPFGGYNEGLVLPENTIKGLGAKSTTLSCMKMLHIGD